MIFDPVIVYRYNSGVAIVSLSLVDGKGHQVPLLQGAPPSSLAYEEIDALTDLKSCIATQMFDLKPDSKKPGTVFFYKILDREF